MDSWPLGCTTSGRTYAQNFKMQQVDLTPVDNYAPAFVLDTPFDSALARIRRAIRDDQLCIAAEIDTAKRVKRALQIQVSPCRLLLVDNPRFMLEATAIDRASGIFLPLHLVVSGAGSRTLVHMLSPDFVQYGDLPIGIRAPVAGLQQQLLRMLRRIADKPRHVYELADRGDNCLKLESIGEPDALS